METGTDDIRAPEHTHRPRGIFRSDFPELHSPSWPFGKSIFENPIHAADRINVPGYRCVRELESPHTHSVIARHKNKSIRAEVFDNSRIRAITHKRT